MSRANLIGQIFGRLRVIEFSHVSDGRPYWRCECSCGSHAIRIVATNTLRTGHTRSCGCLRRESITKIKTTHGMAPEGNRAPENCIWRAMKTRCTNPNSVGWKNYGGRGIKVCDRWAKSFAAFYADMGPRPSAKHSLDRINVNGNYEPGNCRWATDSEQCNNRRDTILVTFRGTTLSVAQWARRIGRHPHNLKHRLNTLPVEIALQPKKPKQTVFKFAKNG